MKKFRNLIFIALSFALGSFVTLVADRALHNSLIVKPEPQREKETKGISEDELTIGAWIPEWGNKVALDSLDMKADSLYDLSPVFYSANPDGTLKDLKKEGSQEIIDIAFDKKIRLTPTIALFDAEILKGVLSSDTTIKTHIASIVAEVLKYDFDGIDLDYESTFASDKAEFFDMLEGLADELHKHDKILIFTALPQWGEKEYFSFPQTRYVQDYERIGKIVDELRLMAYDYTFMGSEFAGAIAPRGWVEEIAKYAASKVDPKKLVLGGRLYGYEWDYDPETFKPLRPIYELPVAEKSTGKAYVYFEVLELKKKFSGKEMFNHEIGENIFIYNDGEKERVLIYPDSKSLEIHKEIAKKYDFKGVFYWRLGGDYDLEL